MINDKLNNMYWSLNGRSKRIKYFNNKIASWDSLTINQIITDKDRIYGLALAGDRMKYQDDYPTQIPLPLKKDEF